MYLYLKHNGVIYIPFYVAYGNVVGFSDAQGNTGAEYSYNAFGGLASAYRFSMKYYDLVILFSLKNEGCWYSCVFVLLRENTVLLKKIFRNLIENVAL